MVPWGSIPAELVICKSLGQALNPHPAVIGTRWNEELVLCEWFQLRKMCIISN